MKLKTTLLGLLFICLLSTTTSNAQEPMLGEIRIFAGNFAPRGWAFCDGQILSISSNPALFSLLGTMYGGDGIATFGLPDLRGKVVISAGHHPGSNYTHAQGSKGGEERHTLAISEMPSHTHLPLNNDATSQHILLSTDTAINEIPEPGDVPAKTQFGNGLGATNVRSFGPPTNTVNGQKIIGNAGLTIGNTGGSQSHNIMQPFLTLRYIIAVQGYFPSRS